MTRSILSEVREKISSLGGSEFASLEDQPALVDLWEQMQDLKEEMNQAKRMAAEEAARPYKEAIEEIEKRYAMLLRMTN